MRIQKLFPPALAAAFAVSFGLSVPALASSAARAPAGPRSARGAHSSPGLGTIPPQNSTTFAGYSVDRLATGMTVTTALTVPALKCTTATRAILASVGMFAGSDTNFSAAELFVGCSAGKPTFFPKLTINDTAANFKKAKAHPGDRVVLKATEGASKTVVTVNDTTTKLKKTLTGAGVSGGGKVGFPWVGDQASFNSSHHELGVPDFGKISFSGAKVARQALGSFGGKLSRFNRTDSTETTLQIKTGTIASNMESFKTIFEHS